MQYSVINTRITCLYGSQPISVVFACKRATFGAEFQVSMCPRPDLSFCACKTASFAPELLVSTGPSPHLWFLQAKQRLLDQTYKSVLVPDFTCRFVHAKQRHLHQNDISIWVPALICVFFFKQNSDFGPDLQVCTGPRPHLWIWAHITACLAQE